MMLPVLLFAFYSGGDTLSLHQLDSLIKHKNAVFNAKITMAVGGVAFGCSYGLALALTPILASSSAEMDRDVSRVLWIPFAGPVAADVVDGMDIPAFTVVCLGWSLTEVLGASLLTYGIVKRRQLNRKKYSFIVHPDLIQDRYPGLSLRVLL